MNSAKILIDKVILEAVQRINTGVSKTLTARRVDEIPPQSSRHLTDTRTRVSTLLEYSLSYEMNRMLENRYDESISNVLWNVFPDLIVRGPQRENLAGLEVKALHTAAEEKSANLSTPISLIRKGKDFLVILVWGWVEESIGEVVISYPHIHEVGIFDAWLIARMRDITWLINTGSRVEGIDISTPIIDHEAGGFKAEEGNLGKVMRIYLSSDTSPGLPYYQEVIAESERYENFKKKALYLGVCETSKDIARRLRGRFNVSEHEQLYPDIITFLGAIEFDGVKMEVLAGPKRGSNWINLLEPSGQNRWLIWFGRKLEWELMVRSPDGYKIALKGKKPDSALTKICEEINGVS